MQDFMEQIERYRDELYRYIHRTVWDSSVADDVFSNAVLSAWENKHKFTPGTNFRAWMYRIVTNKCYVANREIGRTPRPLDEVPEGHLEDLHQDRCYQDVLKNPEVVMEQCGGEVVQAFAKLSTAQKACILLRSVEKFSYKEIAEILDIPVGTVMTHLSRGRAKLRKELLEYAQDMGVVRTMPKIVEMESVRDEGDLKNGSVDS